MRDHTQHRPDKASAFTLAALYNKNALATKAARFAPSTANPLIRYDYNVTGIRQCAKSPFWYPNRITRQHGTYAVPSFHPDRQASRGVPARRSYRIPVLSNCVIAS
jgi:hypothetical protein